MYQWNDDKPLDRAKGESRKAAQALWDYANMGPGRSLAKLLELYQNSTKTVPTSAPTLVLNTLKAWSVRYDWQARVARWEVIERAAEADVWARRREEFREQALEVSELARDVALRLLNHPPVEKVLVDQGEDGKPAVYQIKPMRWTLGHVVSLMGMSDRIGRLTLGEPTETTEQRLSGQVGTTPDIANLSDDDLDDLIAQLEARGPRGPVHLKAPDFSSGSPPHKAEPYSEEEEEN